MNRWMQLGMVGAVALTLVACAQPKRDADDAAEAERLAQLERERAAAEARAIGRGGPFSPEALDDPSSPLAERVVYFGFDLDTIEPRFNRMIEAHAQYLVNNPGARVRLEGHTDERGSREYNLALGERRGHAVRRALMAQGAGGDQLQVISYGEEMPVAFGQDEQSWSLNRRVEIVYEVRQ
ncbi:MAG: peptidoglycan-associated lipoprotein Pal [Thioalkalivibrionaceae bacterium]